VVDSATVLSPANSMLYRLSKAISRQLTDAHNRTGPVDSVEPVSANVPEHAVHSARVEYWLPLPKVSVYTTPAGVAASGSRADCNETRDQVPES